MVIAHNLSAMNAQRQFNIVGNSKAKVVERLSSGYRVNRAADDAAGLAISEKLRRQIRGLTQASANCEDGVSFVQVGDGALHEVHDMLQRINELAVKAANGTNTSADRTYIDSEVQALKDEMKRVFNTTSFNEKYIFRSPYTPDVSRNSDDLNFQLFNTDTNGSIGGILVDNTRYTWKELGLDGDIDETAQIFTKDGKYVKKLPSGENLELEYKKGDDLSDIRRIYRWKADADGIIINDNTTAKINWASMGVTGQTVHAGIYGFNHDGMHIEFEVDENSSLSNVIQGINGDAISETTWYTMPSDKDTTNAVIFKRMSGGQLDAANQKYLLDSGLRLAATADGVKLTSDNYDSVYTLTKWEDFADITTGKNSISDWGQADETSDAETLDESAIYRYKDSATGITIDFSIMDEASKSAVIQSINSSSLSRTLNASSQSSVSFTGQCDIDISGLTLGGPYTKNMTAGLTISNTNLSTQMQNLLGRDLSNNDTFTVSLEIVKDASGRIAKDANGDAKLKYSIAGRDETAVYIGTLSNLERLVVTDDGYPNIFTLTLSNEAELLASASDAEKSEGLKGITASDKKVTLSLNVDDIRAFRDYIEKDLRSNYTSKSTTALNNRNNAIADVIKNQLGQYYADAPADTLIQNFRADVGSSINSKDLSYISNKGNWSGDVSYYLRRYGLDKAGLTAAEISGIETNPLYTTDAERAQAKSDLLAIKQGNLDGILSAAIGSIQDAFITYKSDSQTLVNAVNSEATQARDEFRKNIYNIFNVADKTLTQNKASFGIELTSGYASSVARDFTMIVNPPEKRLDIQSGAEAWDQITLRWSPLSLNIISMRDANVRTVGSAAAAIDLCKYAMGKIADTRTRFGADQNRLEHTIDNLNNIVENTTAAESRIRDADMAKEAVKLAVQSVLEQAGLAVMAQANQSRQGVLALLA